MSSRVSHDPRGSVPHYPAVDDASSSSSTTSYNVDDGFQQIYVNSKPQYDTNISYHGYDLSRDVSEYPVDAGRDHSQRNTGVIEFVVSRSLFLYDILIIEIECTCPNTAKSSY